MLDLEPRVDAHYRGHKLAVWNNLVINFNIMVTTTMVTILMFIHLINILNLMVDLIQSLWYQLRKTFLRLYWWLVKYNVGALPHIASRD